MSNLSQKSREILYQILPDRSGCKWIKPSYSKLGQGVRGSVYLICCNTTEKGCQYVVKQVERKTTDLNTFINKIKHEVNMQNSFASLGFAPKVYSSYSTNDEAFIIMDKIDTNVNSYIESLLSNPKISDESIRYELDKIQKDTLEIVKRSYINFLVHNDLHVENIGLMLDKLGRYMHPKLIDFDNAYKQFNLDDIEFQKIIKEVNQTFDKLKIKLKERYWIKSPTAPEAPRKGKKVMSRTGFQLSGTEIETESEDEEESSNGSIRFSLD